MRAQEREQQVQREQEEALQTFYAKQNKRYRIGRAIVLTIGILYLITAAVVMVVDFEILRFLFQVAMAVLLLCGVSWVRYVLASCAVVEATLVIFVLCSGNIVFHDPRYNTVALVLFSGYVAYNIVIAMLLYTSKAVGIYLYERKHH